MQLSSLIQNLSSGSNQIKKSSNIIIKLKKLSKDKNLSLHNKAKMIIIEKEFINKMKDWVMLEFKKNSHEKNEISND